MNGMVNLHLDQEPLQLTARSCWVRDIISSHQRCNIGGKVAKGSEEGQAVDRFLKPLREAEGGDDEDTADHRGNRADTFNHVDGVVKTRGLCSPVGVVVARHGVRHGDGWCATAQMIF